MTVRDVSQRVEARIRAAQRDGFMDSLPGEGKPLPPDPFASLPAAQRMEAILARNLHDIPEEVELLKCLERLREDLARAQAAHDTARCDTLRTEIQTRSQRLAILFEAAGRTVSAGQIGR